MAKKPKKVHETMDAFNNDPLPSEAIMAFASIIKDSAEIDILISEFIFRLSRSRTPDAYLILGRTPISSKIRILDNLIKKYFDKNRVDQFKIIKDAIVSLISYRNGFCHGYYIGRIKKTNEMAFWQPVNHFDPEPNISIVGIQTISDDGLRHTHLNGKKIISYFQSALNGESLRDIFQRYIL